VYAWGSRATTSQGDHHYQGVDWPRRAAHRQGDRKGGSRATTRVAPTMDGVRGFGFLDGGVSFADFDFRVYGGCSGYLDIVCIFRTSC